MVDFKWIHISLFLIAVLQFPAAAEGLPSSFTVRAGQEVTLPCENVTDDQQNCDSTTWTFSYSRQRAAVELITLGKVDKSKSDRLSVTQNCSLVIKKVTDEDAGCYECQQWNSTQRQAPDSVVHLSVATMTEHRSSDQVTLKCSVSTYDERRCPHTVKWLYAGNNVDKNNKELQTSQSVCSASARIQSSHFLYKSNSDLLKCEVTDENKVQQQFPFRLQPSGEKPGDNTTTTTERSIEGGTITTASPNNDDSVFAGLVWLFVLVPVLLVALVITAVKVIRWKRATGKNTRMNDDADPEGGVSYASVNFTKNPNSDARVRGQDDDAVTYTTLKASSSSAAASHVLYATIDKPNK